MKKQTILSKNIQSTNCKAAYDNAVKCILADKIILAWILKSCVKEYENIDIETISSTYIKGEPVISEIPVMPDEITASKIQTLGIEDVTITEGKIVFDIRFNAAVPKDGQLISLIINIEAQNDFYPGYPLIKRGIYYCSRMISSQYGTIFTNSQYKKIKKVYSIWICMNPPKKRENTITAYSISEKNIIGTVKEHKANYDLLTTIMICLGNPKNETNSNILKLLDILLSSEVNFKEKCSILEEDFNIPMTETFERSVNEMCNLSKGVEEKGIEKGVKAVAIKMLKAKQPYENILQFTELTIEEIEKLKKELEEEGSSLA